MKKPFAKNSEDIWQYIDPDKPVRVYRNLHKKCISVKQGSLVRCHARHVVLKDCKFIVSEAGQKRVRQEGKKNVHAFVQGLVVDHMGLVDSTFVTDYGWKHVYYNPYEVDGFVLSMVPYDEYVATSDYAVVWCDEVLGEIATWNPRQEDGTLCS